jgi:hypothetical protein
VTDKTEKTEFLYKKPHPLVHGFWNDRLRQLGRYIEEQKEKLKSNPPEELRHLRTNLFVDAGLAAVVEANLNESANTLDSLGLQVDKIRFMYEKIK